MHTFTEQSSGAKVRGGSALVMVIVLTVLLGLLSALFMMMARIDEISTQSLNVNTELEAGVDAVIDQIKEVLVEDIFGTAEEISANKWLANYNWTHSDRSSINLLAETIQTNWLHGSDPKANEPWDYPGEDDVWLANLEPDLVDVEVGSGTDADEIGFQHITDLYGQIRAISLEDIVDLGNDYVSPWNLRAMIIDPDDPILTEEEIELGLKPEGQKADADGDGVADSRWVVIPDMTSKSGETMYAAVRIIDNGGMININTAYRNPTGLSTVLAERAADWDGSQLSHVNLEGIMAQGDIDAGKDGRYIQYTRYGYPIDVTEIGDFSFPAEFDDYISDIDYEFDVARRIRSPLNLVRNYSPFNIGDELELRNRFFLSSSVVNRFGHKALDGKDYIWQKTFDPGEGPTGKRMPYTSTSDLPKWYDKATGPDPVEGICNRRHLSTTYNLSRIARAYGAVTVYPESMTDDLTPIGEKRKFPINLPVDIQKGLASTSDVENHIKQLAMAIYRGLPNDDTLAERFAYADPNRAELAWQMAVNMVDYQDKTGIEEVTKIEIGDTTWFGFEGIEKLNKDTLSISKLGYVYVGTPSLSQYLAPKPPIGHYFAVEVFNPDEKTGKDLTDYEIRILDDSGKLMNSYTMAALTIKESTDPDNNAVVVFSNVVITADTAKSALQAASVDRVNSSKTFVSSLAEGWKVLVVKRSDGMPVDCVTVPSGLTGGSDAIREKYRSIVMPDTNLLLPKWSIAEDDDVWQDVGVSAVWQLGNTIDTDKLEDPDDPNLAGLEKVQLNCPNEQLRNLGEIENVLAVGASYYEDTAAKKHRCTTVIANILESTVAVKQFDIDADQEDGIEMGSFGRIRLDDPDYWALLDSLTYFNPADTVDLENIALGISPIIPGVLTTDPAGADPNTLTDGDFFPAAELLDPSDTVNWTAKETYIQIDFPEQLIYGAIVQASGNADFRLEYWNTASGWQSLWHIPQIGSGPYITGVWTRPEYQDDKRWHLFNSPVLTGKVRLVVNANGAYSVSEIQIGANAGVFNPYYGDAVAGRININTAPWYVIKQLPWLGLENDVSTNSDSLAQAIVAFRDKSGTPLGTGPDYGISGRSAETGIDPLDIDEDAGFKHIGQLMQVVNTESAMVDYDIRKYIFDGTNADLPDYTPDTVTDDFEERNLLFHRISNLVTVRSDVYTAYILVRVGTGGPQRRVIAIFDRSGLNSPDDIPKLVALHKVPDPR